MALVARDARAEKEDIDRKVAGRTICDLFAEVAGRRGDEPAIRWGGPGQWQTLTWGQYRERARAATLALLKLGFGKGQFGVIMARNIPEHVIADWGIVHAGGAGVSLYNTLAPEQVQYITNHCEATVAFVEDESFLAKFQAVRDRLPHLRHIVMFKGKAPGVISWDDLMASGEEEVGRDSQAFDRSWRAVKADDLIALIYTSGTTGPPKGVMYSHYNVLWTMEARDRVFQIPEGRSIISYLPLSHIAERFTSHWGTLTTGAITYYQPDLTQLLPTLLDVRPLAFVGVPRVWEKFAAAIQAGIAAEPDENKRNAVQGALAVGRQLAGYKQRGEQPPPELEAKRAAIAPVQKAIQAKLGLDQCSFPVSSTAPIPLEVLEFFAAIDLELMEVWGMSELTGPSTINPPDAVRLGTVGPPMPGQEMKLDDDGEILVRGGNVMVGYYKEPEKTAETIDADGWLRTGDVGAYDSEGYLRIIDRKKEIIITAGGKNMSPANMEGLLKHHPLIAQACVVGDRRPFVTALLVLDAETLPGWARSRGIEFSSVSDLARNPAVVAEVQKGVDYANEQVSRHEQVKKFKILPVEWTAESEELTPTLKMRRRVVNEKYAREIEEMYAV
jgi:long-chain acyl-CoA synthetase